MVGALRRGPQRADVGIIRVARAQLRALGEIGRVIVPARLRHVLGDDDDLEAARRRRDIPEPL